MPERSTNIPHMGEKLRMLMRSGLNLNCRTPKDLANLLWQESDDPLEAYKQAIKRNQLADQRFATLANSFGVTPGSLESTNTAILAELIDKLSLARNVGLQYLLHYAKENRLITLSQVPERTLWFERVRGVGHSVDTVDNPKFPIGSQMRIDIFVPRNGFLTVLDVFPNSMSATVLCPSVSFAESGRLTAGKNVIPRRDSDSPKGMRIEGPAQQQRLLFIFTASQLVKGHQEARNGRVVTLEAEDLKKIAADYEANNGLKDIWQKEYEVVQA